MITPKGNQNVPDDTLKQYAHIASKHLRANNTTVEVEEAGTDETGKPIFGICMRIGEAVHWYDYDAREEDAIAGWTNAEDAKLILEGKILPNIGYTVFMNKMLDFYQNMIDV